MLKDKFGFNFWPSFTDLMLSLVLIVLFILCGIAALINAGNADIKKAERSQEIIQQQIDKQIHGKYTVATIPKPDSDKSITEQIKSSNADITIINTLDRQTITFSDKILFDSGESQLKPAGYDVLQLIGPIVSDNLENVREIQIQGHADIDYTDDFNLQLASNRAIAVYKFLQEKVGIDPAKHLMSVTSFGKYKPVERQAGQRFNKIQLKYANASMEKKAKNRRIEIVLIYNT